MERMIAKLFGSDRTVPVVVDDDGSLYVNVRQSIGRSIDPSQAGVDLTLRFANINLTASGDVTIVSAVPGKKIRVLSVALGSDGNGAVRWKSGSGNISGPIQMDKAGGYAVAADFGLMETNTGESLVLNLDSEINVGGHISYVEVDA